MELFESLGKSPRRKLTKRPWFKVAAVFVVLLLTVTAVGASRVGEALPFGWVFQGLRQISVGDQVLIQFNFGRDTSKRPMPPPPPPDDIEEIEVYQTNLTTTSIAELTGIYPGVLYYPQSIAKEHLKTTQYLQLGDKWIIMLDFSYDRYDILLRQEDIMGQGSVGIGYGPDTEVSFHRLDDVEYMVAEHRYGTVTVKWTRDNKLIDMTSNLTVEESLSVAQSVGPYTP